MSSLRPSVWSSSCVSFLICTNWSEKKKILKICSNLSKIILTEMYCFPVLDFTFTYVPPMTCTYCPTFVHYAFYFIIYCSESRIFIGVAQMGNLTLILTARKPTFLAMLYFQKLLFTGRRRVCLQGQLGRLPPPPSNQKNGWYTSYWNSFLFFFKKYYLFESVRSSAGHGQYRTQATRLLCLRMCKRKGCC